MSTIGTLEQITAADAALAIARRTLATVVSDSAETHALLDGTGVSFAGYYSADKALSDGVESLAQQRAHLATVVNVVATADLFLAQDRPYYMPGGPTKRHLAREKTADAALCGYSIDPGRYGLSPLIASDAYGICKRCEKRLTASERQAIETAWKRHRLNSQGSYDRARYSEHVVLGGQTY